MSEPHSQQCSSCAGCIGLIQPLSKRHSCGEAKILRKPNCRSCLEKGEVELPFARLRLKDLGSPSVIQVK